MCRHHSPQSGANPIDEAGSARGVAGVMWRPERDLSWVLRISRAAAGEEATTAVREPNFREMSGPWEAEMAAKAA